MLSNGAGQTEVLASIDADGYSVTPEFAATLSPYTRKNIRRFGKCELDMNDLPEPLVPKNLPFELIL